MSSYFAGESKNDSPFTRQIVKPKPRIVPGYMYSGSPTSDAARAPFYAPPAKIPSGGPTVTAGPVAGSDKPPPSPTNPQSVYDLSTDPIVQKIKALNPYGGSVAEADRARKQALIDSGFSDLATATTFGSLENPTVGDQATALAAAANPFSVAMNLARQHLASQTGIDQNANRANLYFSSTRGNELGDEARNYLGNVTMAQGTIRSKLNDILAGLVGTRTAQQRAEADAISQARQNAITNAISSGEVFIGYDSNGNPIFRKQATATNDQAAPPPPSAPPVDTGAPQAAAFGGATGPYIGTLADPAAAMSPAAVQIAAANRVKKLLGLE